MIEFLKWGSTNEESPYCNYNLLNIRHLTGQEEAYISGLFISLVTVGGKETPEVLSTLNEIVGLSLVTLSISEEARNHSNNRPQRDFLFHTID